MDINTLNYILFASIIYAVIINVMCILVLMRTIGLWGIFSKLNISEWKSLVPFYNQIVLLKKLKMSHWCILLYLDFLIPIIGTLIGRDTTWALYIVLIGFLIYRYIIAIKLGEKFKKGTVFCFFLAFFPSILYPVLGCSKKEKSIELVKEEKK